MARKIFLICPTREVSEEEKSRIAGYVAKLEDSGCKVYWPCRDNDHDDVTGGVRICYDNFIAIKKAGEVHIWHDNDSRESLFDLGIVYALRKILVIANPERVMPAEGNSFNNVIIKMDEAGRYALEKILGIHIR